MADASETPHVEAAFEENLGAEDGGKDAAYNRSN
jgi:hypothetical protein